MKPDRVAKRHLERRAQVRVQLGRLLVTSGVDHWLRENPEMRSFVRRSIARHQRGDWGNLDAHDRRVNDRAVKTGGRLLSSYEAPDGTTIWVITDRYPRGQAVTTVLFPSEY